MFNRIFRWLRGYVTVRVTGGFPERFLNIIRQNGVNSWAQIPGEGCIILSMRARDYKIVRPAAKKARVALERVKTAGLPFTLKKNSDRKGLLAGAALLFVLLVIMSNFIWTIDINNASTVSKSEISAQLKAMGIGVGTYKKSVNVRECENLLIKNCKGLSWGALNLDGTNLTVETKQSAPKPDLDGLDLPVNIKAARDGVIVKTEVAKGTSLVTVGSGAAKGQLLVSSVISLSTGEEYLVHATAVVLARTERRLSVEVPQSRAVSIPSGESFKRYSARLLWLQSPFSPSNQNTSSYFVGKTEKSLYINGRAMPLGLICKENIEYLPVQIELTAEMQRSAAQKKQALYEAFYLKDCEIKSRSKKEAFVNGAYRLDLSYTCIEDIGEQERIYTSETDENT